MEIILLEKVRNLGNIGDKVKVKRGYGRNYLIPYGKAIPATVDNLAKFELRRADLEQKASEAQQFSQERANQLEKLMVKIPARASEEGKLFGSLGSREIALAISAAGVEVEKSEILLPYGPVRMIGEHAITVQVHSDVACTVTVIVEPG